MVATSTTFTNFKGATIEDLDLQPALTVRENDLIEKVLTATYERDYSQCPLVLL